MTDLNLLIPSIGRNTFFTRRVRAALKGNNKESKIVGADLSWTAPGLQFVDEAYTVPPVSDDEYIPTINELIDSEAIDYVLPANDLDLWKFATMWEQVTEDAEFLMPPPDRVIACTDKIQTAQLFNEIGLATPETRGVNEADLASFSYPAVVKSRGTTGTTRGFERVADKSEVSSLATEYESPIVQEFANGTEYTVDVLCDLDGNPIKIIPRERLSLRAAVSDKGKTVSDEAIVQQTLKLIDRIDPRGFLNAQCIRTTDGLQWIEVNPRIAGGIPLAIAAAGVDELFGRVLNDEKPNSSLTEYETNLYMAKHDDAIFLSENERPARFE